MILAVDVHYTSETGFAAGLGFDSPQSDKPASIFYATTTPIQEYIPGNFYKRELPCILNLLEQNKIIPSIIIIDGYVYLDGKTTPGLGYFLFNALSHRIPIIGVAKTAFINIHPECLINRGKSKRPLYITSIGINLQNAKTIIASMHGNDRIPTLLKAADRICRESSNHGKI